MSSTVFACWRWSEGVEHLVNSVVLYKWHKNIVKFATEQKILGWKFFEWFFFLLLQGDSLRVGWLRNFVRISKRHYRQELLFVLLFTQFQKWVNSEWDVPAASDLSRFLVHFPAACHCYAVLIKWFIVFAHRPSVSERAERNTWKPLFRWVNRSNLLCNSVIVARHVKCRYADRIRRGAALAHIILGRTRSDGWRKCVFVKRHGLSIGHGFSLVFHQRMGLHSGAKWADGF